MKKLLKWIVGLFVTVLLLLVLAVFLLPIFFDPNDHKPEIQNTIEKQIGRSVQLNGDIGWSVFPWIAIELNDVVIDNDSGFKGDYLADIGTLSARVKLLPLLQKNIQVDTVTLKSPDINLQVAASGRSNWQSIIDHLAAEDGQSQSSTSETDAAVINIQGIKVSDGVLNYRDAAADTTLNLKQLNFSSSAISTEQPSDMSLSAQLSLAEVALTGGLNTDFTLNHLLSAAPMVIDVKKLSFIGDMDNIPLSIESQEKGRLDSATDQLNLPQVVLKYANIELTTDIKGKQLSQQAQYSGSMKLKPFQLDALFEALGSSLVNQANNKVTGQMDWLLIGSRLTLSSLKASLDDSQITGQIKINDLDRLAGTFELAIDQLNLDNYLPTGEGSAASTESGQDALDFGYFNGQVKVAKLTAMGTHLNNIKLNLVTNGKQLSLTPLTADFYQGLLRTELLLAPDKSREKLLLKHSMKDIQAAPLLTDLMGKDFLSGLGSLEADIRVDEPFAESPLATANGRISYHLSEGALNGIDVVQIMQQALTLLNKTEAAAANDTLKTEFAAMDLVADVVNGVLKTSQLSLKSPYFNLTGDVEINLTTQTINGTIKPILTHIPEGVLDQRFEKLLNQQIPVSLSGSMLSPKIAIDIKEMILVSQKDKIDAKKEELKQDLFDSILGKKDKPTDKEKSVKPDSQTEPVEQIETKPETKAKPGDEVETNADDSFQPEQKEDSKDKLKRELLEGLFKKKSKPEVEEPDPSEAATKPDPQS